MAHSDWVYNNFSNTKRMKNFPINLIKYAIDINKFRAKDKTHIRQKLNISKNVFILMTTAVGIISNPYKDFNTLYKTYINILNNYKNLLLIVIGDKKSNFNSNHYLDKFLFINPERQSEELIEYYSCTDLYIQSSNVETWGLAISEALSCGLPVIASSVGAIPEQVKGLIEGNLMILLILIPSLKLMVYYLKKVMKNHYMKR